MGVTVSDYREERWAPSVPLVPSAAASPGAEPDGSLRDEEGKQPMGTTEDGGATPEAESSGDEPVGTLRGAGVQVDIAKVGRVVLALVVVALVVVGAVLVVAGYRKNSQVNDLHAHGVPVQVTVVGCLGLMGGSGSNTAGYECTGRYVVHGTSYVEGIPGSTFYARGAVVTGVVSSDDPGLLSSPSVVASSHTTNTLYIVGGLLLLVALAIVGWLVLKRRRVGRAD